MDANITDVSDKSDLRRRIIEILSAVCPSFCHRCENRLSRCLLVSWKCCETIGNRISVFYQSVTFLCKNNLTMLIPCSIARHRIFTQYRSDKAGCFQAVSCNLQNTTNRRETMAVSDNR